jgi:ketosteroid isomerase-like protein
MYKATARWMIRRSISKLNDGDYCPTLAMFADDATLAFPGDNTWANQHRPTKRGRDAFATHRGRDEIEAFLKRYVGEHIHMVVDDILVNGPPWNARAAVRVHHWVDGPDGDDAYSNRAVLFVTTVWGKVRDQEDYEDTERVAAFDRALAERTER